MNSSRLTYLTILTGALVWCAAIILAPALVSMPGALQPLGEFIYRFFRPVCHQLDSRSLHLFGGALAVCSRCSAIYVSFLAGTVLYPFVRGLDDTALPPRIFLAVALLPIFIDGLAGGGLVYSTTVTIRIVTGALAGAVLSFYVIPAAMEGVGQLCQSHTHSVTEPIQKGSDNA